jgi:hypothetical protein
VDAYISAAFRATMKVRGLSSEAPPFNLSVALVSVLELDPQLPDSHLRQNVRDPLDLEGG